jgi:protein-L-isoaspartate(D-aspartate) O-methyltransferase
MATMLEQLDVRPGHRVLEIGAGTGYNAALLACLVGPTGSVTTVDIDEDTVAAACAHLAAAGIDGVRVVRGDGWLGAADGAPYDRIILTVGAADISPAWRAQLTPGGRLVLPLALPAVQATVAFDARDGILESTSIDGCQFMRLRGVAAVPMRRVRVGPEPAPTVWPRGDHAVDGEALLALLRTPPAERATDLVVPRDDLYDAIVPWLGLHAPTSAWITADGRAVATSLVPPLLEGTGPEGPHVASFGLFEPRGAALLVPLGGEAGEPRKIPVGIRSYGETEVGERLHQALRAWDRAGRPALDSLRVRAIPIEQAYEPRAGERTLLRPCTRLVLDWPAV